MSTTRQVSWKWMGAPGGRSGREVCLSEMFGQRRRWRGLTSVHLPRGDHHVAAPSPPVQRARDNVEALAQRLPRSTGGGAGCV